MNTPIIIDACTWVFSLSKHYICYLPLLLHCACGQSAEMAYKKKLTLSGRQYLSDNIVVIDVLQGLAEIPDYFAKQL